MSVHIYVVPLQSAIRVLHLGPRQLVNTDCCHERRRAQHVRVQVYYDGIRRWCAEGYGCKKGKRS
jgi:hypothetical protein